ncbi:MAG: hypothetical protein M3O26_13370 [Pseudomonadota bacterium]|nr:hypothetical protein [Pseudomonadota bacterium]
MKYPLRSFVITISAWLVLSGLGTTQASADQNDPPSRVGRIAYVEGAVSFQPGGTDDWVAPPINRPMTTGDQLWSDRGGRAELQLDGSSLRLSANTSVSLLNLSDIVTQIQLSSGTVLLRVRRLDDNETYEIDTPNLAFTVLRPGLYRLTVDGAGNSTAVLVRRGQGEATGGGYSYPVGQGEYDIFSGTDDLRETMEAYAPNQDAFDAWSAGRDARWDHSVSARYVSPDVVGYEDLDDQGTWTPEPEYGNVWFPRNVEPGWAPYHNGHWAYVMPWGYTWVDDSPWGFAPFHYGRWVSVGGAWGWIPAAPARPGVIYVRPVYAPALVAWVGVGAGVAWFALGPREVYCPSYRVSQGYVRNINVSNTNVNTTVINNVYNTTIINRTVDNNTIYVNRNVAGAVTATTSQAFASAQPVGRNIVRLDDRALASARIAALAPAAVPTKQAVLGPGRTSEVRPPSAVQSRLVVARIPAPLPPPSFERRQEAIKSNGGQPLSVAQLHEVASSAPTRAPVSLAPPARLVTSGRPAVQRPDMQGQQPAGAAPALPAVPAGRATPPAAQGLTPRLAPAPMQNATHPNEIPQLQRPASPGVANSVLERQHLQEQQQQQAKQDADRARLQQQQEAEHQRAAQVTLDRARPQTLDQPHQAQAQQLAQQQQEAERQRAAQQNTDRLRQQSIEQQRQAQAQQLAQQQQEAERQRAAQQNTDRLRQQSIEQQRQAQAQQLAQQQQEAERQRAAQQNTDRLRQQSIEQQRQAQTQQLAQQQEAERQRAAQQGAERAHQQAIEQQRQVQGQQMAQQSAERSRQQALEQQHQAQTQQQAQQHAQEQQQLQGRQQEQRRQQESSPPKANQQTQPPRTP